MLFLCVFTFSYSQNIDSLLALGEYNVAWKQVLSEKDEYSKVQFYIKTKQYTKAQSALNSSDLDINTAIQLQSDLNLIQAENSANLVYLDQLEGEDTTLLFESKRQYFIAETLLAMDSINTAQSFIINSIETGKSSLPDEFKLKQLLLLGRVLHTAEKKNESLQILMSAEVLANSEDTKISPLFKDQFLIELQIEKAIALRKMSKIKQSLELLTGAELSIYSVDKVWALELKSKIYQAFQVALFIQGNKDKMFAYQIKSTLNEKILNEKLFEFFDQQNTSSTPLTVEEVDTLDSEYSEEEVEENESSGSEFWEQDWIIYFVIGAVILLIVVLLGQRIITKKNEEIEEHKNTKEEIQEAFSLYQKEILRKSTGDHKKIIQEVGMLTKRQTKWSKQLNSLHKSSNKLKKQEIIDEIENIASSIDEDLSIDKKQSQLNKSVDKVSEDFKERLKIRYPNLIRSEIELCALIRLRMSNREIAEVRNISISSARTARYRLKKKLNIPENLDIEKVLTAI